MTEGRAPVYDGRGANRPGEPYPATFQCFGNRYRGLACAASSTLFVRTSDQAAPDERVEYPVFQIGRLAASRKQMANKSL